MIEIPLQIIELEQENYHILIEGHFKDETPSYWIIDTGASKTVLDLNMKPFFELIDSDETDDYQSAGINQGMMETSVGRMSYLRFGNMQITDQKVALIDLNHVNDIYSKYTTFRIAGLLGGDILMQKECVIDYARKTIQFQNP
ncbi:MAG: retropepsin-like domain-containing protein [Prolixibacteraceae bacterium]|nr:retropepsin-like domain-containing protein [Prolixibacteraceae bacterium]